MSLISRAIDAAYIKRAEHLLRAEHDQWVRNTGSRTLGTTYWTVAPEYAAADNVIDEAYDIHGEYVFTGYSRAFPSQLVTTGGTRSWEIWYRTGPLTPIPQQTSASWNAANRSGHDAEMRRMAQNVSRALAELQPDYPHSVKALSNA